ncbi:MAG: protein phosphatase CheZ [Betaproteobacteria bacterium]
MQTSKTTPPESNAAPVDVHQKIGVLTRQLHDSLKELGYADSLKGTVDELPDAQSRLSYIARLTGEAAEKVLNRVELAKAQHEHISAEAQRIADMIVQDPVGAMARGHVLNFVHAVQKSSQEVDSHLTEIMMAQDFHDLTGQVISRVVTLTATIEEQLVQLLIQTAPATPSVAQPTKELSGPVVDPHAGADVVTDQSQVDDLLASLGF